MSVSHEIVRTKGGVLAVRSIDASEVMHPGVGPRAEAELLYVKQSRLAERLGGADDGGVSAGTRTCPAAPTLVVFDVGLGAGSNAIAAWRTSECAPPLSRRLELVSFERDLGALELALAHGEDFALTGESADAARRLMERGRCETSRTSWRLERGDVLDRLAHEGARADIVFWDPFSARANPSLWTSAAFRLMRERAGSRCTLFTYSASTAVRIALLLAGWSVGAGDGIGDRLATTAAAVKLDDLARPLDRQWLRRLERADTPLPSDAPPDTAHEIAARVRAMAQFSATGNDRGHSVSR